MSFSMWGIRAACMAMLFACACGSDGGTVALTGTVVGTVNTSEGVPATDGYARIEGTPFGSPFKSDGSYIIKDVPAGPWRIVFTSGDPFAEYPPRYVSFGLNGGEIKEINTTMFAASFVAGDVVNTSAPPESSIVGLVDSASVTQPTASGSFLLSRVPPGEDLQFVAINGGQSVTRSGFRTKPNEVLRNVRFNFAFGENLPVQIDGTVAYVQKEVSPAGVEVRLIRATDGTLVESQVVGEDGAFSFSGPPFAYVVRAIKGSSSNQTTIPTGALAAGQTFTVRLLLSLDVDGDGIPNEEDDDIDGDGIPNSEDAFPYEAPIFEDTDGDGVANQHDPDNSPNTDEDSHPDFSDNCPSITNENQIDVDLDTVGDACDNCPNAENSDQTDGDNDGVGDVCDNCPTVANPTQDPSACSGGCTSDGDCADGKHCKIDSGTCHSCLENAHCDDGLYCNGEETCDNLECANGTPPDLSDGVACTDDSCDEVGDKPVHTPNSANCDNGLFCDGAETCNLLNGCQAGTPPNLSDGVACTDDSCDEVNDIVVNTPNDSNCDNGMFCDGPETCEPTNGCQPGTPPSLGDGVSCTDDTCNELTDQIVHTPNDENCDNGLFCDGVETCHVVSDCVPGVPPTTDDGVACTLDSCREDTDEIVNTPIDANCDDGLFCNGTEVCDPELDCQAGSAPSTDDGVECTDDFCDEVADAIVNIPNPRACGEHCFGTCNVAMNQCVENRSALIFETELSNGVLVSPALLHGFTVEVRTLEADFLEALLTGEYNLVIVDVPTSLSHATRYALGAFAALGNPVIFASNATLEASSQLRDDLGIADVASNTTVDPISGVPFAQGTDLFNLTESVPNLSVANQWNHSVRTLTPSATGETAGSWAVGGSAIVVGNNGRSIAHGFTMADYSDLTVDADMDFTNDMEELLRNEIEYLCRAENNESVYLLMRTSSQMRRVDPTTIETQQTFGLAVVGAVGFAIDPTTDLAYFIDRAPGTDAVGNLSTIDLETGATVSIAPVGRRVSDITFDRTGELWAVTSARGAALPQLVSINKFSGEAGPPAVTFLPPVINSGAAIAFNPQDDKLYMTSANYFVSVDLLTFDVDPIVGGPGVPPKSMDWDPARAGFLVSADVTGELYSLGINGATELVGTTAPIGKVGGVLVTCDGGSCL